jgi:hypothetical protein
MKRVFFFGVVLYSAMVLLLNDWPAAVGFTGTAALPWMAKCLVDFSFGAFGLFKLFGDQIHFDDEEIGIHPDDVSVPDTWFYGVFGLNLLGNFLWHGYQFATQSGAVATYNSIWFFAEFAALALTFILYKHAAQVARREARKAMQGASSGESVENLIRSSKNTLR